MNRGHQTRLVIPLLLSLILASCASSLPPVPTAQPTRPVATTTVLSVPTSTATLLPTATTPGSTATETPTTSAQQPLLIWVVAPTRNRDQTVQLLGELTRALQIPAVVVGKSADGFVADLAAAPLANLALPDLVWGGADDLFLLHERGLLQVADDGLDEAAFLPATLSGATLAGQRWGTPVAGRGYLVLLANRKLTNVLPTTTDQLAETALALRAGDRYGLVTAWIEGRWLEAWLAGYGGRSTSGERSLSLDTPAMRAALELLVRLRAAGPPPPSTYLEGVQLFREGKVAYAIDGDWSISAYRRYTDTLDLAIAPLPLVNAGGPALAPIEGVYLMYNHDLRGAQRTTALQLGKLLSEPVLQRQIARDLAYLPARTSILQDAVVQQNPLLAAGARWATFAPGIAPTLAQRCAWQASEYALPPLLLEEADLDETLASLQERAEQCMASP